MSGDTPGEAAAGSTGRPEPCGSKALQSKEIMGKITEKQILANSSGENFRFHYRKSTLFNVENVKI